MVATEQALAKREEESVLDRWTAEQVKVIRQSVAQGANEAQLRLFLEFCSRRGLDPFIKQVYWTSKGYIVGIDGFRAKAEETGRYCPGEDEVEILDDKGKLVAVEVSVLKFVDVDRQWHVVRAKAKLAEYDAGTPIWKRMPTTMLAKCAEAKALRKAFPQQMGGMYTAEELDRANTDQAPVPNTSKSRVDGIIERVRSGNPEAADVMEAHMPYGAAFPRGGSEPAVDPGGFSKPEPDALDADELERFDEAIAVDDIRDEEAQTEPAPDLAGIAAGTVNARAYNLRDYAEELGMTVAAALKYSGAASWDAMTAEQADKLEAMLKAREAKAKK